MLNLVCLPCRIACNDVNFDYVRLLSVEISLLMMNLPYRMPVIICFLLFAHVSLDSSSVQIGRMQCKFCTNVVQTLSNEVYTYPTKQCTPQNLEKQIDKRKTQKESAICIYSAEIYERVVQEHNQCSTSMFTKQCTPLHWKKDYIRAKT